MSRVLTLGLLLPVFYHERRLAILDFLQKLKLFLVQLVTVITIHRVGFLLSILLLFSLQFVQALLNVRIDKVRDVVAVKYFRNLVVFPIIVLEDVALPLVRNVDASAAAFLLDVLFSLPVRVLGFALLGEGLCNRFRYLRCTNAGLGQSHVKSVEDVIGLPGLQLLVHPGQQKHLAGFVLDLRNPQVVQRAHCDEGGLVGVGLRLGSDGSHDPSGALLRGLTHVLHELHVAGLQLVEGPHVRLVANHEQRLVGKEGLDRVEKVRLLLDCIAALLRYVDNVQNDRPKVG
mmetsp:Transcript_7487/g.19223  ORF Transcript_7487/g.19223 Transcript_7487/m.19223 type:complete len:288 (-) Transcript_7487:817-1680(-)